MSIIGKDLPEGSDGSDIKLEEKGSSKPKKPRPFRFDDNKVAGSGNFSIAGNKLKFAGLAILGVMVAFTGYSVLGRTSGEPQSIPFMKNKVEDSHLSSVSGISVTSPAKPVSSPIIAASAPTSVMLTQLGPVQAASSPQAASSAQIAELPPEPPQKEIAVALPTIEHFQVALLVKQIDENKVMVEYSGKDYLVKPGQRLPGGETVFIGFDRNESVMRTTAGDHRIFMK